MTESLLVGLSALGATQRAIEVTSHNIANAATPGYTRQRAELAAQTPENIRPGQLGRGVTVQAIARIVDKAVVERLRAAQADSGRQASLQQNLKAVETIFNEPGANGLSAATDKLFSVFQDLSNNPESVALRSTAVEELRSYSESIASLGSHLAAIRDDLKGALEDQISQINGLTTQIADLNQQIRRQTNLQNQPNDLLDRRDGLLKDLSKLIDVRVHTDPRDNGVTVDVNGKQIIGLDKAEQLKVGASSVSGSFAITDSSGLAVSPSGGSVSALYDLHRSIIPDIQSRLDSYAATFIKQLNAVHSVGTSQSFRAQSFASERAVIGSASGSALDDASQVAGGVGVAGIPESFLPSYTDAGGTAVARNLTINVYDTVGGTAQKYTLRYDPASGSGGRSFDDLVQAINTGLGGGFTLYPPRSGGIDGVTAHKVAQEGGFRLQLDAGAGKSIDFSPALDVRPSATAWTGGTVTVSGNEPTWAGQRVVFTVQGSNLQVSTRDPNTGNSLPVQSIPIPGAGVSVVAVGGLTVNLPAGTYRDGDSFAVGLSDVGQVLPSNDPVNHVAQATWAANDAGMVIKGRYTGELGFDPARPWSVQVVTTGTIGAVAGTVAPNNPAVVQFTYYTGSQSAPTQQTVQVTLDDSHPAGAPVEIADGVYVVFDAGQLSQAGNRVEFSPDAHPDEAGLLPALGINGMFTGHDAASIAVAQRLQDDPAQLAVGATRSEGDNANLLGVLGIRSQKLMSDGSFTLDDWYQSTVSSVGVRIQQAQRQGENQDLLAQSLEGQRDAASGVNIDEEVGNLILLQQAYQAAAKVVSTARENISALMNILG